MADYAIAFREYINQMPPKEWLKLTAHGRPALHTAEAEAAWDATGVVDADAARWSVVRAIGNAAGTAVWDTARAEERPLGDAATAAIMAAGACAEIQGAKLVRERGRLFFFLPLFGFGCPEEIQNGRPAKNNFEEPISPIDT